MCEYGKVKRCYVRVPARLSHTGKSRWKWAGVDECIADLVNALNKGGVHTVGCCCGHGKGPSTIELDDGRVLEVRK